MKIDYFPGILLALLVAGGGARVFGAPATNAPEAPPMIANLTPEEEAKTFFMPEGYEMECVLSDPIIKEPVTTVFDGNGRMYVAEMRSYMQTIDGANQRARSSRVSLHWSSKGNGVYDRHTVFADNLVLPRMVLPLNDGVLINETDSADIWLYRDTKGTGVADEKRLFYAGGPIGGNLEHQPGGMIYDVDNWLYMAVNAYRLRIQGTNVLRENTPANGGQWGLAQDDYGRIFFVNAGYESGAVNFQVPIIYGAYNLPEAISQEWPVVYPLIGLADVQGGPPRFRPENKSLNHFTATCGPAVYRGDKLPADLRGDLLYAEPVGRLIRRDRYEVKEGFTKIHNFYDKSEFIRSTDPEFRPVNVANAPDGNLYITDMYRGIIQEKDWVGPGSYLRGVVEQFHMDQNIGHGRIWRLVYKGSKPDPQPHMLDETAAKLVPHLASMNGWWRDTAQEILVLRGDKSVVPELKEMARSNTNDLARLQALWTLEGLDALDPAFIREKMKDPEPQLRVAAIRTSESLIKKGDVSLIPDIDALAYDPDARVVVQVMLTANLLKWPDWGTVVRGIVATNHAYGVEILSRPIALPPAGNPNPIAASMQPTAPPQFTAAEQGTLARGEIIYKQLCFTCHAPDGKGTPLTPGVTMAPPLGGSKTATGYRDGVIDVVLKGLSGPVDGKAYTAVMVPMESNNDDWIASVISYVRNNFGNHSTFITSNDVARVRAALHDRTSPWTLAELQDTLPQPLANRSQWVLTASDNASSLPNMVDYNPFTRYSTGQPQRPGMWLQVELPEVTEITGVELDAGNMIHEFPRGYRVMFSADGKAWQAAAVTDSSAVRNQILFPPVMAKFINITLTASDPTYSWSISEMQILKAPDLSAAAGTNGQTHAAAPQKPRAGYE